MPEVAPIPMLHVSSAVVRAIPGRTEEVIGQIEALQGAEVAHSEGSKIIVVMETETSGAAGAHLVTIASFDGVLSANLVFEHAEPADTLGEPA